MRVLLLSLLLVACASKPTIPPKVCAAAVYVVAHTDAYCIEQTRGSWDGATGGRVSQVYSCIDQDGTPFTVVRTPSDKS